MMLSKDENMALKAMGFAEEELKNKQEEKKK